MTQTSTRPSYKTPSIRAAGITLVLAGHYATETAGVRAMAEFLGQKFSIPHAACGCPPVSIQTWFDNFSGDRV